METNYGVGADGTPEDEQAREAELVRRIHRAVGGPAKLSTYDDPAAVRQVVLDALAAENTTPADVGRVLRGELTAFERRVVRTVTNRGAAVRSRMRQRRELARLRDELRRKDERIAKLEAALATFTQAQAHSRTHAPGSDVWVTTASAVPDRGAGASHATPPLPPPLSSLPPSAPILGTPSTQSSASVTPAVSPAGAVTRAGADEGAGGEREAFGNLIDQMLSRI